MTQEQKMLEEMVGVLVKELSPQKIYLFGSRAKNESVPSSDFDFALDCVTPDVSKRRKVREMLEAVAGLHSVDIIFLSEVESGFRKLVLETGSLVYEQKRGFVFNRAV